MFLSIIELYQEASGAAFLSVFLQFGFTVLLDELQIGFGMVTSPTNTARCRSNSSD